MFLDITQIFDKAWHPGHFSKLEEPSPCILQNIRIVLNGETPSSKIQRLNHKLRERWLKRTARNCLRTRPIYQLYKLTPDIKQHNNCYLRRRYSNINNTWRFRDSRNETPSQAAINKIDDWAMKWRFKINEGKSTNIIFTLLNQTCPIVQNEQCFSSPEKGSEIPGHASW